MKAWLVTVYESVIKFLAAEIVRIQDKDVWIKRHHEMIVRQKAIEAYKGRKISTQEAYQLILSTSIPDKPKQISDTFYEAFQKATKGQH